MPAKMPAPRQPQDPRPEEPPQDSDNGNFYDPNGLGQSIYDFTSRVFPEDLGQEDNAHYMVININVPVTVTGQATPINKSYLTRDSSILKNELSKVDQLRFGRNNTSFADNGATIISPSRGTRRIKESIALHMPNGGLVFTETNKYEEVSMTAMAGSLITSGIRALPDRFTESELGKKLLDLADAAGNVIKRGSQLAGYPINPAVEVLFSTREQRQWMFEVFMLPRSESEVKAVREIIRTFRFHAAPEITGKGFFFIPPAEFDITFYHNGKENKNLPRINTCVLDRIDVDYAPEQSYATFANGHPIAVRMSLGFREVEILHKKRVYEGF